MKARTSIHMYVALDSKQSFSVYVHVCTRVLYEKESLLLVLSFLFLL